MWSEHTTSRWDMEALGKAKRQAMLTMPLSSLLLTTALPHFPFPK